MPATPPAIHSPPAPNPATPGAVHAPPVSGGVPTLVITGSFTYYGSPFSFPPLIPAGDLNGRPAFSPDGSPDNVTRAFWNVTHWALWWDGNSIAYRSDDNVATPDLASTWYSDIGGVNGTPVVTLTGSLTTPPAIHSPPARTPGNPPVITP